MSRMCGAAVLGMVLLTGCGPTIIAYPPPTMLPGTLDAPEPGKVDLAVGTSVWAGDGGAALNFWGGGMLGAAAFGLPENVDLSLTASRTLQGPHLRAPGRLGCLRHGQARYRPHRGARVLVLRAGVSAVPTPGSGE